MKKVFAFFLVFTLLLACCGCSSGGSDSQDSQKDPVAENPEYERLVRRFLTALFSSDVESAEACVPDALKLYYRQIVSASHYEDVVHVDMELDYEGQLDAQAIEDVQAKYLEETGIKITISDAYLYGWRVTMHYIGTEETKTANSDQFGVILAQINGRMYALSTL